MTKEVTCSGQRKPGTCFVLVELHPIYFDPEKPQVICFGLEEPQAISSDQKKNLTENKVEATFSVHEKPQDTYFARGALRDIFLGLDGRSKQQTT